jgi:uncharacterized protein (TIGR03067 family)
MLTHADEPAAGKPKKDGLAALQGTWVVESQIENGEKSDLGDRPLELEFKAKGAEVRIGDAKLEAKIRIDPATTPKIIDFEVIPPDGSASQQLEGIYEFDDKGRLRICVKQPSPMRERPTAFESKTGSNTVLVTLKRKDG